MLKVHLNGDIIKCTDTAAIQREKYERWNAERRCKYGIHEYKCERWKKYVFDQKEVKNFSSFGRCIFPYNESCPMHKKCKEFGNQKKTYKIDSGVYRKLSSAAHYLVHSSDVKTLFLTITFPPFRRRWSKYTRKLFNDYIINQKFSMYVENLRTNYGARGYVAVRENGTKNNRVHFHILLSIPFVPFTSLNDSWNNTIKDICSYSPNAIQRDNTKPVFINNPIKTLRYITKYFSKCIGKTSFSRIVFISNNIIQKARRDNLPAEDILSGYKGIYINKPNDYVTIFRITDNKSFSDFCNNYLFPLFELEFKRSNFYSYPINSS